MHTVGMTEKARRTLDGVQVTAGALIGGGVLLLALSLNVPGLALLLWLGLCVGTVGAILVVVTLIARAFMPPAVVPVHPMDHLEDDSSR